MTSAPTVPASAASTRLQPGDIVRVRDERWRVRHVTPHGPCAIAEVAGAEPSNAGHTGHFILPFEPTDRLPRSVDRPRLVRPAVWRRAARAILADATPAWTSLRTAARSCVQLLAFQLEPAIAITSGVTCRVLLADEVGLGKTIQAGLVIAELRARERDARVLIVTPAGLREQWQAELSERFGVASQVVDAPALARSVASLPPGVNPWGVSPVVITSVDFVKRPDVIRSLEALVWDVVVFDEAHALGGRSDRAMAAELVACRGRRVVTITATPHSGDERSFGRLCAIGRLAPEERLLIFRRSRVDAGIPGARSLRFLPVAPNVQEAAMHRALASYADRVSRDAPAESVPAARLAMLILARRACSSAASLARSLERRIALLGSTPDDQREAQLRLPLDDRYLDEDDEPLQELSAPGLPDRAAEQRLLQRVLAFATAVRTESKIAALARLLRRVHEPALVFTEYRDTLQHVASALQRDGTILHGGLTAAERARETRRFTHGTAGILLATDAASEGINLHHRCRLVINLDVPWSPLRLEQRVGRVDRLGQQRRVHAVTFVARGTQEVSVASALSMRADRAEQAVPFSASMIAQPSRLAGDLCEIARREAVRLGVVRAMTDAQSSRERTTRDRPVLTIMRRGKGQVPLLAVRLLFVDRSGSLVWSTVVGARVSVSGARAPAHRTLLAWLDTIASVGSFASAPAVASLHQEVLDALRSDLRLAIEPLIARERRILESIERRDGRLAAPLIQPGLFDRRALRDAEAQRRVAEEVAARTRERTELLESLSQPVADARHLVFAVAWSR